MTEAPTKLAVKAEKKGAGRPALFDWRPIENLRHEIDRVFDDFSSGSWSPPAFGRSVFDVEPFWRGEISWGKTPAVDFVAKDGGYEVTAELPGMDEKDIELKFADGILTIQGEKEEEKEEKKEDHYLSERRYGSFKRSFRVPDGIDADKIQANFTNGVLTVTLPKSPEAQKKERKIAIGKA